MAPAKRKWEKRDPGCEYHRATLCTLDAIRRIATDKTGMAFVWPDEGNFQNSKWVFNEEHVGQFEPLWIDPTTAHLLVRIHDMLKPENQVKFRDALAKDRGTFGYWVEESWKLVRSQRRAASQ